MESKLQFKRRHAENSATIETEVDWEEVEQTLKEVDPEETFSDPRFDPLKHALRILGSVSAEKDLNELREHWVSIDALVDSAVDTHYSGFNKSLQNYSQILRLFSESMAHLSVLRRTLEAAQIRLHPEPVRIKELYRRELMLSDVQRLLEDIQAAVTVPEKVRKLEQQREWSLAVTTLLDGCNKVAREELLGVGALRTLRDDLSHLRESLLATLTVEIERCVYDAHSLNNNPNMRNRGVGGVGLVNTPPRSILKSNLVGDGGSISAAGSMTMPRLRRHGSSYLESPSSSGRLFEASPMRRPTHRRAATYSAAGTAGFGSFSGLGTFGSAGPGGFIMSGNGHLIDSEVSLTTLVTCVAQLGGVQAALRSLRTHMPSKIRAIIAEVLDSFPRSQWLAEEGKQTTATSGQRNRDAATASTTSTILEAISSRCLKTLHSLARVIQLLAMARPPATTAGLQMLLGGTNATAAAATTPDKNTANTLPIPSSSPRAANSPFTTPNSDSTQIKDPVATALQECRFAWECMQFECQVFIAPIIGAPVPFGLKSRRALLSPDLPGGGWLASVGALEAEDSGLDGTYAEDSTASLGGGGTAAGTDNPDGSSTSRAIMFSLAEEATSSLVPTTTTLGSGEILNDTPSAAATMVVNGTSTSKDNSGSAAVAVTEADLATMLSSILGSRQGRPELVAAVYKPMIVLVDEAERLLEEVAHGGSGAGGASGQQSPASATTPTGAGPRFSALLYNMPAIPWKLGGLGGGPLTSSPSGGAGSAAGDSILRSFLDNFSRMEFLPAAYVTTRARCRALLEAGDALRPRVRLRGSYRPGAAVLPAATGAVEMAEEVLSWAATAPPFATHLAGVLENVLARVLEAFQEAMATTVSTSTAGKLADDVRVVQIMAKEPAAPLVGPPVSFFIGANADAIDSFVSSAIAAGFGSSQKGLERDLIARILADPKKSSSSSINSATTSTSTLYSSSVFRAESLLAAAGEAGRLIQLASLAESADHVADTIHAAAAAAAFQAGNNNSNTAKTYTINTGGGGAGAGGLPAPRRGGEAWRRHIPPQGDSSATNTSSTGMDLGFAEGIAHAADRYRAFAGKCIRALRLELILLAAHHLEALPRLAAGGPTAAAAEEHVASLPRVVTQLDEALAPYLPPDRRMYIFGSLPPAVVQISVGMLPQFTSAIDTACVSRVCRVLSALQPVLCAAGGVGEGPVGPGMPDPTRQLEKAKMYYSLLLQSPEALISTIASKPKRFSGKEYSALLNVNVVGRKVTTEQKQQLNSVLSAAAAAAAAPRA